MTIFGLGLSSCQEETTNSNLDQSNPFFTEYETPFGVPPFDVIKSEHYMPAFIEGMAQQIAEIDEIVNNTKKPTIKNTIRALDNSGKILSKVSHVFFGLSGANTNDEIQAIQREVTPLLTAHGDNINFNEKLFERVKELYDSKDKIKLTEEEAFILENMYKGFVRSGIMLQAEEKEKMKALNQRESGLVVQFNQNELAETNAVFTLVEDVKDLAGLPQANIDAAAATAKAATFTMLSLNDCPSLAFLCTLSAARPA